MGSTSTILATIALTGSGMTSQTLAVGKASLLSITSPSIESGAQTVPVTSAFTTLVDGTVIGALAGFLYIKNTEATTEATIEIYHASVSAGKLAPGEWGFFPTKAGEIIKVQGSLATTCEYGFWSKAS
tara:strand:+ start:9256 stop:9639 length:384 start_codon:yes stop_codon:yes gene_type:complete